MARRKGIILIFLLVVCWNSGRATEKNPWLGNLYEFELRPSSRYQGYSQLSSGSHSVHHRSNDVFLNFSVANAVTNIGLEVEVNEAFTRHQNGDLDHFKLTGRYLWLDDIAGDALSLVTGLSFIQAFRHSLHDVSSFHHGFSEGELFLTLGKEHSFETTWSSRWWGLCGVGMAERGSPWIRFDIAYEKRWLEKNEGRIFVHSLWGLGKRNLHLHGFKGYGSIQHESIDIGCRYTFLIDFFGSASVEYSYRLYARNFPLYTHQVLAQILYTFGL